MISPELAGLIIATGALIYAVVLFVKKAREYRRRRQELYDEFHKSMVEQLENM